MELKTKITIRYWAISAGTFITTWLVTGSGILALAACAITITIMTRAGDA